MNIMADEFSALETQQPLSRTRSKGKKRTWADETVVILEAGMFASTTSAEPSTSVLPTAEPVNVAVRLFAGMVTVEGTVNRTGVPDVSVTTRA